MMELRHLRYFAVLAEELHFGRAAARLHITQPPLTRQIRELERQLNVQLFTRSNRAVQLTEAGKVLLGHARDIEKSVSDAVEATRRAEQGEEGRLAIGYVGAAAYHLLPNVLRAYCNEYPRVALHLHDMKTAEQLEALGRGLIDVGLMRPTSFPPDVESAVVQRERFVVALPAEHRLSARARVDVRALANESFVSFPATPELGLHRQICDICRGAGFEPRVVQTANETRSIVGLVGAGFGVSIVTSSAQRMNISGVVYRPLRGVKSYVDMLAVWRSGHQTPVAKRFVAALRRAAATLESV